jgi:hypothetical protein
MQGRIDVPLRRLHLAQGEHPHERRRDAQHAVRIDAEAGAADPPASRFVEAVLRAHVVEDDVPASQRAGVEEHQHVLVDLAPGAAGLRAHPAVRGAELVPEGVTASMSL